MPPITEDLAREISTAIARRQKTVENLDKLFWPKTDHLLSPPIFIIGAPRTGSTLLYQALLNAFRFGYISNLHCRFHRIPCLIDFAVSPLLKNREHSYSSRQGQTSRFWEASECGEFWYRWFRRRPQSVGAGDTPHETKRDLRRTIAALTASAGAPLLFKNMPCALRLPAINEIFPEALFIVCNRDVEATAVSILQSRRAIHGRVDRWWSLEPPGFEKVLNRAPAEQVVWQIQEIAWIIDRASEDIGRERFHPVSYESFCRNPEAVFDELRAFLRKHDVTCESKGASPQPFKPSQRRGGFSDVLAVRRILKTAK